MTFTTFDYLKLDSQVSVTNAPGSEAWVLSIDMARRGDRGHYECQVRQHLNDIILGRNFLEVFGRYYSWEETFKIYFIENIGRISNALLDRSLRMFSKWCCLCH